MCTPQCLDKPVIERDAINDTVLDSTDYKATLCTDSATITTMDTSIQTDKKDSGVFSTALIVVLIAGVWGILLYLLLMVLNKGEHSEIAHLLESAFRKPFLASRGVPAVCETGWFNEFEEQVEEILVSINTNLNYS